ncbi:MAG: TonB-dependent receptor [Pseudomonadota bacterium]
MTTKNLVSVGRAQRSAGVWMVSAGAMAISAVLATGGAAMAQDDAADDDIIYVTARKKEESLSDVPLAITALTAETLEQGGVQGLNDIADLSPGLTFNSYANGNFAVPTIRGIAQTDIQNIENNVSTYINGVYISNKQVLDLSLLDLDRVEVVKGPQNGLYGRNSFSGAINYITAPATSDEFKAKGDASYGSDEFYEVRGAVNIPLIEDVLAVRIAAGFSSFDGTIENTADPDDNAGGFEKSSVLASVAFTPTDEFSADAFIYYNDQDNDATPGFFEENNAAFGVRNFFGPPIPAFGNFEGELVAPDSVSLFPSVIGSEKDSFIAGLTLSYDLTESITITSVTSYGESDNLDITDGDFDANGTALTVFSPPFSFAGVAVGQNFTGNEGSSQDFAQELRVDFQVNDRFDFTIGGYYTDTEINDLFTTQTVFAADAIAPGNFTFAIGPNTTGQYDPSFTTDLSISENEIETIAVFGAANWAATDRLRLGAELRYTSDSREAFNQFIDSVTQTLVDAPGKTDADFDFVTPRFTADYDLTDDLLVYASAARGAKAGGLNNTTSASDSAQTFDTETNWTYELGAKGSALGGALSFDGAIFYTDWQDLQISTFVEDAMVAVINNVDGGATVYGGEIQFSWDVTDRFNFSGGYAFTEPEFDDDTFTTSINDRDCGATSDFLCTVYNNPGDPNSPSGDAPAGDVDFVRGLNAGGNQLARTSRHQANFTASAVQPVTTEWEAFGRVDVTYQSKQFITALNEQFTPGRTLVNMRAGVRKDGLAIEGWVRNLGDTNYTNSAVRTAVPGAFPVFSRLAFIAPRRAYGLTVRVEY